MNDKDKRPSNNPNNEPTGHHTGRCGKCGSRDLWDDETFYGCRTCGATFPNSFSGGSFRPVAPSHAEIGLAARPMQLIRAMAR